MASPQAALATLKNILAQESARKARAYRAGERAKTNGWFRESPFYNDPLSDEYFFKGYDGA